MKNESEETQHCALVVVERSQKFPPPQTLFPGVWDGQNLISWDGHYLHLQTQFGEDRCTQFLCYRGNRSTNKHTDSGNYNAMH